MKVPINREQVKFYAWAGLGYMTLFLFIELIKYPNEFPVRAVNTIWRTVYIVAVNFISFEYTLPFIRQKRHYIVIKIIIAFFTIWALIFLYSFGLYFWRYIGIQLHIHTSLKTYANIGLGVAEQCQIVLSSVFFFGIIKHIYDFIKLKRTAQKLLIEKQAAELNYLKSQTNPHFLFNTLNNIYSLARDKSDMAPESILRLSKILRFMLYETGGAYIALEQELKIIDDYIALEKLRYDDSLQVNFNYDVEDINQALPPLLLIPLVENAFKHGVSETRNQPFVDIHLTVNKRQLAFVVKNSTEEFHGEAGVKENIGLSNLRRQLELLYTDYNLTVQQGGSVFTATLTINLASHV